MIEPESIVEEYIRIIEDTNTAEQLYINTKKYLEDNKDILSPKDKGDILILYLKRWKEKKYEIDIKDTEYSKNFESSLFGTSLSKYDKKNPMLLDLNLENADMSGKNLESLIFISVHLKGANFSRANLNHSHFQNCDLSEVKTQSKEDFDFLSPKKVQLNQCCFTKCILNEMDLTHITSSKVVISDCDARGTKFLNGIKYLDAIVSIFEFRGFSIFDFSTEGLSDEQIKSEQDKGTIFNLAEILNPDFLKKTDIPSLLEETSSHKTIKNILGINY